MDYEHDDRRAADVPGAPGAEDSGLPAGREPLHADSSSPRSPEVRAFDPHGGSSGLGPSDLTASGNLASGSQADDLFDAMFLSGGMPPPAFAAVDHDLGFPPPQAPDLASAFLAALDAIDDRRFVTPVPEEPPAARIAPVEPAAAEPAYELRPQSQLELESAERPATVEETAAGPVPVKVEGAEPLPWDTGRVPVAGLLTMGGDGETNTVGEPAAANSDVEEFAHVENVESSEDIEEAAYYAAGHVDEEEEVEERDEDNDDEALMMLSAAEIAAAFDDDVDADAADAADAAVQASADADAAVEAEPAIEADAAAEAETAVEADAAPEADTAVEAQTRVEAEPGVEAEAGVEATAAPAPPASIVADAYAGAAVDSDLSSADAYSAASVDAEASTGAEVNTDVSILDVDVDDDIDPELLAALALAEAEAEAEAELEPAMSAEPVFDVSPGDDDFEFEPAIGMDPIDAAPMAFDGPDAFAPVPMAAAEPEPEPEPESDVLEDLQDYVVFSLGDMRCVVPIRNVVEVGRIPDAAPVPNAPGWLYGLGNLRGQVLSLIDLRALFGVGRIKASAGRMVVLRGDADDITAGVMVDQVHQIVALSPSRFKDAPAELPLPDRSTGFVWGACDYGNFTMIGLDVDGVLGVESMTEETV